MCVWLSWSETILLFIVCTYGKRPAFLQLNDRKYNYSHRRFSCICSAARAAGITFLAHLWLEVSYCKPYEIPSSNSSIDISTHLSIYVNLPSPICHHPLIYLFGHVSCGARMLHNTDAFRDMLTRWFLPHLDEKRVELTPVSGKKGR